VTEGWSADMVTYLYGKEKVTPFFDSLSNQSLRFTNAFSTGFRTDQGLMSILSGVPSIQSIKMPDVIDKVNKYPSLPREMKSLGRITSFIYGGDLNFSNLYNYLTVLGFDTIIGGKDFDLSERSTAWGVPDHITVGRAVEVIDSQRGTFFSMLLLLSSHAPFDVPIANEFTSLKGHSNQYKSSVRYSDVALRMFFEAAKTKPWYKQSIFIVTSDHGSTHTRWAGMEDHNRFRIPLLIFDPLDSFRINNSIVGQPCNHFDIPSTLTKMAGGNAEPFIFSRDILCADDRRRAYWNTDVAAGIYGGGQNKIVQSQKTINTKDSEAILFVDMIKSWFNSL